MNNKSILVIEDHADSCEILKEMFHRHGMQAECAAKFEEGMIVARARSRTGCPFSCILTDLTLPDSTAEQTVKRLHEFGSVPVRAISGTADPAIIEACRRAGVHLILKGTSAEGILESILLAIADHEPSPEIYQMLATNRPPIRELIPAPRRVGFWSNWSPFGKAVAIIATVLSMMATALTLGGTLYKGIEDKVVANEHIRERFAIIETELKFNKEQREKNVERLEKLEDDRIRMFAKLDQIVADVGRIESKLERKP